MSITIDQESPSAYQLAEAILIYTTENPSSFQRSVLAMQHDIERGPKGALRFGAGRTVTRPLIARLLDAVDSAPLSYVPPNVIAIGRNSIAWHVPAHIRPMFFNARSDAATQAFDRVPVPQPPLVFVARGHRLSVFAVANNDRPSLKTPLAPAPYWNVNETGDVCIGSTPLPQTFDPSDVDTWTNAFFGSNFTHMNTGKRWRYSGTYSEMLAAAIAAGEFKAEWLEAPKTTIEAAVCGN